MKMRPWYADLVLVLAVLAGIVLVGWASQYGFRCLTCYLGDHSSPPSSHQAHREDDDR